jgi:hypothetical protein
MKTNTNTTPSVVSTPTLTPAAIVPGGFTLGLELGDRSHHVCVLDTTGQIVREGALSNTRPAPDGLFKAEGFAVAGAGADTEPATAGEPREFIEGFGGDTFPSAENGRREGAAVGYVILV